MFKEKLTAIFNVLRSPASDAPVAGAKPEHPFYKSLSAEHVIKAFRGTKLEILARADMTRQQRAERRAKINRFKEKLTTVFNILLSPGSEPPVNKPKPRHPFYKSLSAEEVIEAFGGTALEALARAEIKRQQRAEMRAKHSRTKRPALAML